MSATRDLVNTPAEHMGPAELAAAAKALAKQYGASFSEVVGDALLKKNFPSIHAVGRASTRASPDRADWGNPKHPKLALVGKGVCFDPAAWTSSRRRHAPDEEGHGRRANALGLATLIMA
jgi:leucyl aminopeptidase